jgi:hypothetical protein
VQGEALWKSGHPNTAADSCVHITLSNQTANDSIFATDQCSTEYQYICEAGILHNKLYFGKVNLKIKFKVRKSGTRGKQLQKECQDVWNVSLAEIENVDSNSFDPSNVTKNIKVRCYFLMELK